MQIAYLIIAIVAAYLIGSVPFAVVVSRAMGLADPRTYGSRNPGATNVLRGGNKFAAALTLVGDGFKGWFVVWLAVSYGSAHGLTDIGAASVAVAVFLGHLYPIFLRFQGGKGVATAGGVILAMDPLLGLAAGVCWIVVAALTRYASVASLFVAICAPVYWMFLMGTNPMLVALLVISALVVYRHRANIRNLLAGTERRIGEKREVGVPR